MDKERKSQRSDDKRIDLQRKIQQALNDRNNKNVSNNNVEQIKKDFHLKKSVKQNKIRPNNLIDVKPTINRVFQDIQLSENLVLEKKTKKENILKCEEKSSIDEIKQLLRTLSNEPR